MDPFLLLAVAEGIEPGMVAALLDPHDDPARLLAEPPPGLPRAVRTRIVSGQLADEAGRWLQRADALGCTVLTPPHRDYPERMRHAPLRPLVLFARGDLDLARRTQRAVAVVGSRTATPYGEAAARDFCETLARARVPLWSGLAVGIDAATHEACLRVQTPTVAVQAGGLDHVYPAHHDRLRERIFEAGGLVLSELPPGRRPSRGHFPRRNRILALATEAVLVVEAGLASGSLHTARFAAEAATPVFAVPGPYTSGRSRGCHRLLEEGAMIASDPEELLRQLGVSVGLRPGGGDASSLAASADETAILRILESGPRPADLVQRESRLPTDRYLAVLLDLIDHGVVAQQAGDLLALGPRHAR